MKFSESLKKNRDFQQVYRRGTSEADRFLVMYVLQNGLKKNRVGVSVSKKVGNSVVRHHLTRLIREAYRLQEDCFSTGLDLVIIARVGGRNCTQKQIYDSVRFLGKKHHILEDTKENEG